MGQEKFDVVLIVGPEPDEEYRKEALELEESLLENTKNTKENNNQPEKILQSFVTKQGKRVLILGDRKRRITKKEISQLKGKINQNAEIHISGHGVATPIGHKINICSGKFDTINLMNFIDKQLPKNAEFHLHTCQGGAIFKDLKKLQLQNASSAVAHSEPDNPALRALVSSQIKNYIEQPKKDTLHRLQKFLNNLYLQEQTASIYFKDDNGKEFKHVFRPPLKEVLQHQEINRFLNSSAKDFIEKVRSFDTNIASKLQVPNFNELQCKRFRNSFFAYRLLYSSKESRQFLENVSKGFENKHVAKQVANIVKEYKLDLGYLYDNSTNGKKAFSNVLQIIPFKDLSEENKEFAKKIFQGAWRKKDYKSVLKYIEKGMDPDVRIGKTTLKEYSLTKPELLKSMIRAGVDYSKKRGNTQDYSKNKEVQEILEQEKQRQEPQEQKQQEPQEQKQQEPPKSQDPSPEEQLKIKIQDNISQLKKINEKCAFVKDITLRDLENSFKDKGISSDDFSHAFDNVNKEFKANQNRVKNVLVSLKYRFKQALSYIGLRVKKGNEMGTKASQAIARNSKLNKAKAGGFVEKLMREREQINRIKSSKSI